MSMAPDRTAGATPDPGAMDTAGFAALVSQLDQVSVLPAMGRWTAATTAAW
jgi:hypothetical protein